MISNNVMIDTQSEKEYKMWKIYDTVFCTHLYELLLKSSFRVNK